MITTRLFVSDMVCEEGARIIEQALAKVEGVAAAEIRLAERQVVVTHDVILLSVEAISIRLDHLGFPAIVAPC